MTHPHEHTTPSVRNPGRVAGLWYLAIILIGPLRLIYIPNKLFVTGNSSATVSNLAAHEWLFRSGIVADLIAAVCLVMTTLALYRLFKGVDQHLAMCVVIIGGVLPGLLYFVGSACDATTMMLVRNGNFLAAFDASQRDTLAVLFLKVHDQINTAAEFLWGAWLFPLAMLVWRSRLLPRFIAVWLAVGGVAYVALSVTGELTPQHTDAVFALAQPAFLGEIAFMLWLVIKGARPGADA